MGGHIRVEQLGGESNISGARFSREHAQAGMMTDRANDDEATVAWERLAVEAVETPVVRQVPYLELKLEHPDLEADGFGEGFVPDAVPYELDGTARVFYWRPALSTAAEPGEWVLACATTHALAGVATLPADGPPLCTPEEETTTVVVDGTVGGDSTTARVAGYAVPTVRVLDCTADAVELRVDGTEYQVAAGKRRRLTLAEQQITKAGETDTRTVTPELAVRYPGRRELHHPAPGASYRLFPSFGLDVDALSNPLAVPTAAGELDHVALAESVGVDLSERPYPERVLWQAFAFAVFDPHADVTTALCQLETGHIVCGDE